MTNPAPANEREETNTPFAERHGRGKTGTGKSVPSQTLLHALNIRNSIFSTSKEEEVEELLASFPAERTEELLFEEMDEVIDIEEETTVADFLATLDEEREHDE